MPFLATNQRRPNAPIELGANRERVYFFTPSNPADPGSVHVCDLPDDDYDLLVKVEGYFPFRGTIPAAASRPTPPVKTAEELAAEQASAATAAAAAAAAKGAAGTGTSSQTLSLTATETSKTKPPATDPAADTSAAGAADETSKADELTPAEIEESALKLLELSWQRIQAEIEKGGIPAAVAQRALDIELAKPEADQKLTVIKKLRSALGVE